MVFKEFIGLFLFTISIILFWIKRKKSTRTEQFPGPKGIPLLGNLLDIVKNPHEKFSEWAEQYGPLYEIRLGTQRAVVLSDIKAIKHVFGHFNSTGKFQTDTILLISRGPYGIINSEGKHWSELRKFCIQNLKTFGFGSQRFAPLIIAEANEMLKSIETSLVETQGDSIPILKFLMAVTNNALWTVVTGTRIETDNAELNELMDNFDIAFQKTIYSGLAFLPWLKYIAPSASGSKAFDKVTYDISEFMNKRFAEHKRTYRTGVIRHLIDCYIEKLAETADPNSAFFGSLGEKNSAISIMELFIAGRESTAHTINYAFIYLSMHKDVQEKLYREISKVIGEREPTLDDKFDLPYTGAVILETLRHASFAPIGVFHKALGDIIYKGHKIPKGTVLISNSYRSNFVFKIYLGRSEQL